MSNTVRVLGDEMVFVIIYDPDKEMIYLQQKDATYWAKDFRLMHSFVGTGIRPENRENARDALARKLKEEMPFAQKMITDEMRFWKTFRLPWRKSVEGEYACHVFVRMMASRYEMSDLVDAIRSGGKKRATPTYITVERFKQIPPEKFMGSLGVVAGEFLEEIEKGSEQFWESLEKNK
jgi:hypothetical protein